MKIQYGVTHFTSAQKVEFARIEDFIERMSSMVEGITPAMGKAIANTIQRSNWRYSSKSVLLNIRYYFVKNEEFDFKVPQPVARLLEFLETKENIIPWNEVYIQMEVLSKEEGKNSLDSP